ncbi:MAG: hypothetical protein IJY17_05105 [Alphaproteobacteria bacterium]|nr:hypothetical protein [Alphaproteobacteria bacterium]
MTEFMKTYKLKITVFSPVHIGASADLEPTEYVIYSEGKAAALPQKTEESVIVCLECGYKNPSNAKECGSCGEPLPKRVAPVRQAEAPKQADSYLYTFTPGQLSQALSDAEKNVLMNEARKGELMAIQSFFKNKASALVKTATKRAFVCREVAKKYEEKFGKVSGRNNDFNQFIIEKQISDPVTGLPYIPGSSIKGAIRTALMSAKNERRRLEKSLYKKGADAEKALYDYKNPTDDPFKDLKIRDGSATSVFMTNIDTAENVKRKADQTSGQKISTYMEVVPAGVAFEAFLSIAENGTFGEDISSIQKACNDFYSEILSDQEDHQIYTHGISSALFEKIRTAAGKPKAFLLSLGKHGGAESKTVDGLREIRIMPGKPARFDNHATTYWFANDGKSRQPFGWCVVEYEEVK